MATMERREPRVQQQQQYHQQQRQDQKGGDGGGARFPGDRGDRDREREKEKEREGEGGGIEEGGNPPTASSANQATPTSRPVSSASPRGQSQSAALNNNQRIGPWHQPNFSRQRALADRLSTTRSASRPQSRADGADRSCSNGYYLPEPSSIRSPYENQRRPRTTPNPGRRVMSAQGSSTSYISSVSSPRRQQPPQTPRYGCVSPRRQPPLYPNSANSRKFTDEELDSFVSRVTKPTVSSRGGVDLLDKDFTYIKPQRLKTLPRVPGLERRYLGVQSVDSKKMDEIVYRLTRMTSAYTAKFAPNKNVWIDMEPGAHMVQRGHPQSV